MVIARERARIAQLLGVLLPAERMARDCALAQSGIAADRAARRFLITQARQEAFHAKLMASARDWVHPRSTRSLPGDATMVRYRALIERALQRGDLAESLVGQQVILEGLGHVVCERIHAGIAWRRLGFTRIGALVAHQERVHHAFGVRALERMIDDDHARRRALAQRAAPYLALIDEILGTLAELFAFFAEDPLAYRSEMVTTFPGWLRAEVQPSRVDGTARETP